MERYLADLPITIYIHLREHDPFTPEHRDIKAMKAWLRREPESLSFKKSGMISKSCFASPLNLVSVSEHKPFVASLGPEGVGLEISTAESSLYMPEETLMDLWQQLRDSGFMSPQNMPLATDEDADFMVPFLANLPYVKPVKMTDSGENHFVLSRTSLSAQSHGSSTTSTILLPRPARLNDAVLTSQG